MTGFVRCVSQGPLFFFVASCGKPAYNVGVTFVSKLPCAYVLSLVRKCVETVYGVGVSEHEAFVATYSDMVFVEDGDRRRGSALCRCIKTALGSEQYRTQSE